MQNYTQKINAAREYLQSHISDPPRIGILTGTGLGSGVEAMAIGASFAYSDIPHFPLSTAPSHHGRLLIGELHGTPIIAMQGRFHLYEGYTPGEVTFPIRVMQALGVETLILSNAAGGLNADFQAGDIMLIADHINLTGSNPLTGPNESRMGPRFPDMGAAYDPELASLARQADRRLCRGVYVGLAGPSLETPAEVRFLKTIGADAVGFSTVHEVIAGVHASMRILALSILTNIHDPDTPVSVNVDAVIATARAAAPRLARIIQKVVADLGTTRLRTSPSNRPPDP